ncbi:MAG: cobalamin biosynthesis protein CbiM [Acidobacteria bacterium]|nr:cobalamin biosynthesis protein CbiM [Acidobacteriota bacterium]
MHIADGVLPAELCVAAHAVAWTGVYALGRRLRPEEISRMGLLAAASFVASLAHFPLGGVTVHLGLYGLIGVILGRRGFPVVFATLLFQALLFQHGGLLSLGVNAVNMGAGALAAWGLWSLPGLGAGLRAFAAGFVGTMLPAVLMATEFALTGYGRGFAVLATAYLAAAAIEGLVTAGAVSFFQKTKPEILQQATA